MRLNVETKEAICREYAGGASPLSLLTKYEISNTNLYRILKAGNVEPRTTRKLDATQSDEVLRRYENGESASSISADFGVHYTTILNRLKELGVTPRTRKEVCKKDHGLREDAFDTITEESAYWVGMLMSDGCIHDGQYSKQIILGLSVTDRSHVEEFRKFLNSGSQLYTRHASADSVYPDGNASRSNPSVSISVTSDRLAEALERYGVVPRKSLAARVIGLEDNRDFWRGAVDGDGWVSMYKGKVPLTGFCGSFDIVHQFRDYVARMKIGATTNTCKFGNIWYYRLSGDRAVRPVTEALYSGCRIALPRKLTTAQEIMSRPAIENQKERGNRLRRELDLSAIMALRRELGSYAAVASSLGVSLTTMERIIAFLSPPEQESSGDLRQRSLFD